jgi:hypothetical protein
VSEWVLFSADADKIKNYVFESAKLPEIRGASMVLDDLNWGYDETGARRAPRMAQRTIADLFIEKGLSLDRWPDGHLVYAGGGSLLAVVPNSNVAAALQTEIEALYPQETGAATISCDYQPVSEKALEEDFARVMAAQAMILRRRKEQRDAMPFYEAMPHQRRCASCGIRPATRHQTKPTEAWLCTICDKKRSHSNKGGKAKWTREFEQWLAGEIGVGYRGDRDIEKVRAAQDIEEIAQAGRGQNLVGFVYADGNRVGRFIESLSSIAAYQQKSQAMEAIMLDLVYTALAKHLRPFKIKTASQEDWIHPFEILTIGGDDVLLIVPADRALQIAVDICKGFGERVADWRTGDEAPLTMSAGVVIANAHNPIRYVQDLAEQLLKSAKKRSRKEEQKEGEGTLDFLVLKSQSMLWSDLRDLRHRVYHFKADRGNEQVSLVGRPYTLDDMAKLLAHARLLRDAGFPNAQLQSIRRALRQSRRMGRDWSSLWYLRQKARHRRWRAVLGYIENQWKLFDCPSKSLPPWRYLEEKDHHLYFDTVWEDLYEVRSVLPRLKDEPQGVQGQCRHILDKARGQD